MNLRSVVRTSLGGGHQQRLTISLCAGAIVLLAFVVSIASPAVAASSFPDVSASHPYYTAIEGMATRGLIEGYTDGTFGPSDLVKRQQFAKMIVLTMGYEPTENDWCPFPDVEHIPSDLYPFHFVAKAASTGLTTGYTNGTFGPDNPITRQQVITMVERAGGSKLETPPLEWRGLFYYGDPTHGENLRMAEFNSLLEGLEGPAAYWDVTQYATRGECAQILWNLAAYLVEERTYETVDVLTTYERLSANPDAQLIDVREPAEWVATGVPPGALLIRLAEVEGRASAELASDRPVYVICKSGTRSRQAAEILIRLGFTEVYNVNGGILAWLEAGLPVETYELSPNVGGDDCG